MNNKNALRLLLTLALVALLPACASLPTQSEDIVSHTVAPGEGLGDIAIQYTGDVNDWQKIADFNGIDDPKTLKAGRALLIPIALIRENADIKDPSTKKTFKPAEPKKSKVKVESADIERNFELNPLPIAQPKSSENELPMIRVAGSYFPKVIYRKPRSTSALMLRVAPGEIFELKGERGDWYEVQTDIGIGYIRIIDALIVE